VRKKKRGPDNWSTVQKREKQNPQARKNLSAAINWKKKTSRGLGPGKKKKKKIMIKSAPNQTSPTKFIQKSMKNKM